MFNYTKDFIYIKIDQIRKISKLFDILFYGFGLIYPIFAIFAEIGNFYINVSIITIFSIYLIVKLIIKSRKVDKAYKCVKLLVSAIGLVINIYSIYTATTAVNGVAVILSTLMTIFWIFQVIMFILTSILVNEFNTLQACIIEDLKPTAKIEKIIREKFHSKPFFDFDVDSTPDIVNDVAKKARDAQIGVINKNIKNIINKNYLSIVNELDSNKDGQIDFVELVNKSLKISYVYQNKKRVYHNLFASKYKNKNISKFLSTGLLNNGVNEKELLNYCDLITTKNKQYADIIKEQLVKDNIIINNVNDSKKILIAFSNILVSMQEIIYLFGYKQLKYDEPVSEEQLDGLMKALSICLNDDNTNEAKEELLNYCKNNSKLKTQAKRVLGFIKNNKETIINKTEFILPYIVSNKLTKLLSISVNLLKQTNN